MASFPYDPSEEPLNLMSTASTLRAVAIGALALALPALVLLQMPDIALALAACGAVSAVLAVRRARSAPRS